MCKVLGFCSDVIVLLVLLGHSNAAVRERFPNFLNDETLSFSRIDRIMFSKFRHLKMRSPDFNGYIRR